MERKRTDKELLDLAIALIKELIEDDPSYICETLYEIADEEIVCKDTCDTFCTGCIMRFLKYCRVNGLGKLEVKAGI